jgi:hypothetical protein
MALVVAAFSIAGCASNASKVRTRGALDLNCDASDVNVELTDRPYLGVTRYDATGCGATRSYQCSARFYLVGVPLSTRTCRRAGEPGDAVISPNGVRF